MLSPLIESRGIGHLLQKQLWTGGTDPNAADRSYRPRKCFNGASVQTRSLYDSSNASVDGRDLPAFRTGTPIRKLPPELDMLVCNSLHLDLQWSETNWCRRNLATRSLLALPRSENQTWPCAFFPAPRSRSRTDLTHAVAVEGKVEAGPDSDLQHAPESSRHNTASIGSETRL
jgi:hypothetical protein